MIHSNISHDMQHTTVADEQSNTKNSSLKHCLFKPNRHYSFCLPEENARLIKGEKSKKGKLEKHPDPQL
jgi:hypothetical protein